MLLFLEQPAHLRDRRIGLNAPLDVRQLPLGLPVLQRFDATEGLFPGRLAGLLEENLEEHAPVAFFELRSYFGSLYGLIGEACDNQRRENFLRLEPAIELSSLEPLRQLAAKSFGLRQHADQSPLHGLGRTAYQFRLDLQFAVALGGCLAEGGSQHGLVQMELLRDPRGPFRAKDGIRNLLDVGQEKIYRAPLPF